MSRNFFIILSRINQIRTLPPDLRLIALTHGLTHCAPDEAGPLAEELVSLATLPVPPIENPQSWWAKVRVLWWLYRNQSIPVAESALIQILCRWDRLPASARAKATLISVGRIGPSSEAALQTPHSNEKIALALSAQDIVSHELAPMLVTLLGDANSRVVTSAERGLTSLANAHAIEYGSQRAIQLSSELRTGLCNQVARSIAVAPSDSKAPFAAALALLDPSTLRVPSDLSKWLLTASNEFGPLRSCLRNRSNQLSRLRSWQWLHLKHLSQAGVDRLVHSTSFSEHQPLLERGHLAIRPARQAPILSIAPGPEAILPAVAMLPSVSDSDLAGLLLVARFLKPSDEYLQSVSLHGLHASNLAKHRLVRVCLPESLLDLAFDANESIARSALLRWSATGIGTLHRSNAAHAAKLARSPHLAVRTLAEQELEQIRPGDTSSTQSRMCTWRMLSHNRAATIDALRSTLHRGSVADQMQTLGVIRRHLLLPDFCETLENLASASLGNEARVLNPHVLATIVSLLRHTATSLPTLLRAADNPEPRVRANAMESLLQNTITDVSASISGEISGKAIESCDDDSPRVRANSIRGLLLAGQSLLEAKPVRIYEPRAVSSLLAMLHDARSLHRLSGVWAAERVLCGGGTSLPEHSRAEISDALTSVSKTDMESHVRRRAVAATRRLVADFQLMHTQSAGTTL